MIPPQFLDELIRAYIASRGLKFSHLAEGTLQLSNMFTGQSSFIEKYMDRPGLRHAYTCYYLPLTVLKLLVIFDEIEALCPSFFRGPLDLLDFGCGPGSGAIAALLQMQRAPTQMRYTGVDRTPAVTEDLEFLLDATRQNLQPQCLLRPRVALSVPEHRFDLVIVGNVLSELEDERFIFDLLENHVRPQAYLILVEPALKERTHKVMALRDALVERGYRIAAPCPSLATCPMRRSPSLWCHADVPWGGMSIHAELDRRTGLRKESLKFSYLVVTSQGPTQAEVYRNPIRVVSNRHAEKGKFWSTLCGHGETLVRAEVLRRHRAPEVVPFLRAQRGDVLADLEGAWVGEILRVSQAKVAHQMKSL